MVVKSSREREEVGVSKLERHACIGYIGQKVSRLVQITLDPCGHEGGMYRAMMFHMELAM